MNPDIRGYFRASTSSQLTQKSGPKNLEEQINIVIFDKLMKGRQGNHSAGSADRGLEAKDGARRYMEAEP